MDINVELTILSSFCVKDKTTRLQVANKAMVKVNV